MGQASVDVHPVHRHVFGGVHGCGLCVGQQFSHATVADDTSQNALSTFIGVFIFSVMALIALKNDFYDKAGVFALFVFTVFVFAMVILAFIRWVGNIARLGRLGNTIGRWKQQQPMPSSSA